MDYSKYARPRAISANRNISENLKSSHYLREEVIRQNNDDLIIGGSSICSISEITKKYLNPQPLVIVKKKTITIKSPELAVASQSLLDIPELKRVEASPFVISLSFANDLPTIRFGCRKQKPTREIIDFTSHADDRGNIEHMLHIERMTRVSAVSRLSKSRRSRRSRAKLGNHDHEDSTSAIGNGEIKHSKFERSWTIGNKQNKSKRNIEFNSKKPAEKLPIRPFSNYFGKLGSTPNIFKDVDVVLKRKQTEQTDSQDSKKQDSSFLDSEFILKSQQKGDPIGSVGLKRPQSIRGTESPSSINSLQQRRGIYKNRSSYKSYTKHADSSKQIDDIQRRIIINPKESKIFDNNGPPSLISVNIQNPSISTRAKIRNNTQKHRMLKLELNNVPGRRMAKQSAASNKPYFLSTFKFKVSDSKLNDSNIGATFDPQEEKSSARFGLESKISDFCAKNSFVGIETSKLKFKDVDWNRIKRSATPLADGSVGAYFSRQYTKEKSEISDDRDTVKGVPSKKSVRRASKELSHSPDILGRKYKIGIESGIKMTKKIMDRLRQHNEGEEKSLLKKCS